MWGAFTILNSYFNSWAISLRPTGIGTYRASRMVRRRAEMVCPNLLHVALAPPSAKSIRPTKQWDFCLRFSWNLSTEKYSLESLQPIRHQSHWSMELRELRELFQFFSLTTVTVKETGLILGGIFSCLSRSKSTYFAYSFLVPWQNRY